MVNDPDFSDIEKPRTIWSWVRGLFVSSWLSLAATSFCLALNQVEAATAITTKT
jgi:hypothetical protein